MIDPREPDYTNTPADPRRPRFGFRPEDPGADPALSIVTPVYGGGAHLAETARSVLAQSLQQWEWILVHDDSPDPETRAQLDRLRGADPRIRVIDHPHNRGPGAARNTGFEAARSDYVFTLDDDDLLEPTALEKCRWRLETAPGLAFVGSFSVGFGGQRYLWPQSFERGSEFLRDNYATGRALVRRSAWETAGGYDEGIRAGFEDWDFWLRAARAGLWGGCVPEYLDWYRRRADHGDRWSELAADRAGWRRFRRYVRETYPELHGGAFPEARLPEERAFQTVSDALPFENRLAPGPPRVLVVVPWFALGGSDKFALDVTRELSERGYEVTLAATQHGDQSWLPEFTRFTPDVHVLDHVAPLADRPRLLRYLIGSRRPEIVLVTHSELGYLLLPYLRACCPEPAYVDYTHIEEESWRGGGYPRHAAALQPCLDRNLTSSRHLKEWMGARGADPSRIDVVHTNVDPDRWRRCAEARRRQRRRWDVEEDEPVLLFAGRFCAQKQPRVLCRTLASLAKRGLRFRAVLAGDGEERAFVERAAAERGLRDRVILTGPLRLDEVRDAMSASDLFFLPSRWEGIALSLFEAMAMELAVVAADVGGQRELVDARSGVLVARGDEDAEVRAYTEVLARLLADPKALREMGRAGRARVREHFRMDQMAQGLLQGFARAREHAVGRPEPEASPLVHEWATQAVEFLRTSSLADHLWAERQRGVSPGSQPHPLSHLGRLSAAEELQRIEASRAWRLVQGIERSPWIGGPLRALGLGGAALPDDDADPDERLHRIKSSRRYRWIQGAKRFPGYRLYARWRYGPGWERDALLS